MYQLERTKYSFLFCLGMSTIISVIYYLTRSPPELKPLEPKECRPFSGECQVFLPSTEEGLQWHRHGCQVCRMCLLTGVESMEGKKTSHKDGGVTPISGIYNIQVVFIALFIICSLSKKSHNKFLLTFYDRCKALLTITCSVPT